MLNKYSVLLFILFVLSVLTTFFAAKNDRKNGRRSFISKYLIVPILFGTDNKKGVRFVVIGLILMMTMTFWGWYVTGGTFQRQASPFFKSQAVR